MRYVVRCDRGRIVFLSNPKTSTVYDKIGYAIAPNLASVPKHSNWLWAWALAVPLSSQNADAAKDFALWATSTEYTQIVVSGSGWVDAPPGTRASLYGQPEYKKLPFSEITLQSIISAHPLNPTIDPVPYTGVQYVGISEFASFGNEVSLEFAASLKRSSDPDLSQDELNALPTASEALARAQTATALAMDEAGYYASYSYSFSSSL